MKYNNIKHLTTALAKTGGRNNQGKITVRHLGGGHKKRIFRIDYKRNLTDIPGTVIKQVKNNSGTSNISLICYPPGILSYIVSPQGINVGNIVLSKSDAPNTLGNHVRIANILIGSLIHNIEHTPGRGGTMVRAAGTYAVLISKGEYGYAILKLPSGQLKKVSTSCMATIGIVSNILHHTHKNKKAGHTRHLGIRPKVRGVAMNPVDHPHGGGEGKSASGRPSVSYKGIHTKGMKTRKNKRTNFTIVKRVA